MTTGNYAIVEFVEEKAVEVVSENWIEACDGVLYSYWPRTNAAGKVKKAEMPDKETWKKYRIRVFSFTDTYKKALKYARKAEETSNFESESDSDNAPRKRARPSRKYYIEFRDWSDGDESDFRKQKSGSRTIQKVASNAQKSVSPVFPPLLPVAPTFPLTTTNRNSLPLDQYPGFCTPEPSQGKESLIGTDDCVLPGAAIIAAVSDILTPNPSNNLNTCTSKYGSCSASTSISSAFQRQDQCENQSDSLNSSNNGTLPLFPTSNRNTNSLRQEQDDNFQRSVLTKLDTIIQKQDEARSILRLLLSTKRGDTDMLEDVLPNPIDCVADLEALSVRLGEEDFVEKMLQFLVALCGHSCPVSTRRILAKLGTNKLWSLYSLKGRKSKLSFKDLSICRIVIKACLRVHKKANELGVEEQIAEYLKHAPHKPGGSRYKDRETPKEQFLPKRRMLKNEPSL